MRQRVTWLGTEPQNSLLHSYREAWRKTTVLLRHCSEDWKQMDKGHRVLKWHGSAPSVKSAYYCRIDTKQGPYRRQAWLILTESPSTWEVEAGGLKIVLGSIYQDWVHSGQQNSKPTMKKLWLEVTGRGGRRLQYEADYTSVFRGSIEKGFVGTGLGSSLLAFALWQEEHPSRKQTLLTAGVTNNRSLVTIPSTTKMLPLSIERSRSHGLYHTPFGYPTSSHGPTLISN